MSQLADSVARVAESDQHAVWLLGVDRLIDAGLDPFLAVVDADPRGGQRQASATYTTAHSASSA